MKLNSVIRTVSLALSVASLHVQAADAVYAETQADEGTTSKMLARWAAGEGITVMWEALYDIRTAYSTGKSPVPLEVEAESAKQALVRFIARARAEEREREAKMPESSITAPPLFACYYAQSKTFVVRQLGQPECGAGRTPNLAG